MCRNNSAHGLVIHLLSTNKDKDYYLLDDDRYDSNLLPFIFYYCSYAYMIACESEQLENTATGDLLSVVLPVCLPSPSKRKRGFRFQINLIKITRRGIYGHKAYGIGRGPYGCGERRAAAERREARGGLKALRQLGGVGGGGADINQWIKAHAS